MTIKLKERINFPELLKFKIQKLEKLNNLINDKL